MTTVFPRAALAYSVITSRLAAAVYVNVHLTGSGPGCPDLGAVDSSLSSDVDVVYYYDAERGGAGGELRANSLPLLLDRIACPA